MHRHRVLLGAVLSLAAGVPLAGCSGDATGPAASAVSSPMSNAVTTPGASSTSSASTTSSISSNSSISSISSNSSNSSTSSDSSRSSTPTTTPAAMVVTAASIAAEISATERGIRDASLAPEAVAELGRRQQRAYRLLARNTDLQGAVTALIPADVATAYGFNTAARQAVADHAAGAPPTEPSPTLPAWTILEPRPIDELVADYHEAETTTGVPWEYLAAINFVETRMGRIGGASSAGAVGPMQFLPSTWAACCTGDITDPHDAIVGAATYLASNGAPADMHAALDAYNPNEGYVGAVTAYASNLITNPLAYRGYHAWEVYVGSAAGTVRLPVGYRANTPIDAVEYVRSHPEDLV